ncbi:UNVERIFIED_CONTAM: spore germination protein (amino acid permease) [Acetivibrio alkalicellulosi]
MDNTSKLKSISMLSIVIHSMIGLRLLTLPRDLVSLAGNDAWISVLISGLVSLIIGYSYYWLGLKYRGLNLSQIAEAVFGKFIGKIILSIFVVYITLAIGLSIRAFSDSIQFFLLDTTPSFFIIISMIIACTYCLINGIKTISILMDILLPVILFSIILLVSFSTTNMDRANLLPVLHTGIMPVLGAYVESIHPFLGLGVMAYVMPHFSEFKDTKKWIFIGILIVTFIYIAIVMMCIMVFGSKETEHLIYPTIILSKSIQFEVQLFERAESFFISSWIPITFSTMLLFYYSSVLNLKALFNTNKHNFIVYLHIPVLLLIALYPKNIVNVYEYLKIPTYLAAGFSIISISMPVISILKSKKKKNNCI